MLLLLSATLAFGLEHWLKRWWISALAPLPIYLAYVWLEVNVLPFHRGGFPGWEAVLVFVAPIVVVGGAIGAPVARSRRRADRSEPSNALYPPGQRGRVRTRRHVRGLPGTHRLLARYADESVGAGSDMWSC